jgi:hypothetical protein
LLGVRVSLIGDELNMKSVESARVERSQIDALIPPGRRAYAQVRRVMQKFPNEGDRAVANAWEMGKALSEVVEDVEVLEPPLPEQVVGTLIGLIEQSRVSYKDVTRSSFGGHLTGHTLDTCQDAEMLWLAGEAVYEHAYGTRSAH